MHDQSLLRIKWCDKYWIHLFTFYTKVTLLGFRPAEHKDCKPGKAAGLPPSKMHFSHSKADIFMLYEYSTQVEIEKKTLWFKEQFVYILKPRLISWKHWVHAASQWLKLLDVTSLQSHPKLCPVRELLIYLQSQVPLFEMDQEEYEEEDVLSMKSRGKKRRLWVLCLMIAPFEFHTPYNYCCYAQ